MSRLIDADETLQKTWSVEIKDMFHMTETVEVVSAIDIKEAPTVEAIPIDWFKNLIKTVEDSKNYKESEILKWALNKWENQEKEK